MDGCGGGGEENLTFGKGVRLNNVEISMDHVEEDPHGPWLVVSVGIINRRRYKPKIQRLHRWRGPLSAGVRPDLSRGSVPLIRLLLAACGPPAEQQDEPPCPQHGSEKSSFVQKRTSRKENSQPRLYFSLAGGWRGESGWLRERTPVPLGGLIPAAQKHQT